MQDKINILDELKEAGAAVLTTIDNRNYFYVPNDYFNKLPGYVTAHIFLQRLTPVNLYTVPVGYFENLPDLILEKINIQRIYALDAGKKNTYSIPENYFNNLADTILEKIKRSSVSSVQQELEEIAPLLSKIPKTNVYSVPENYFATDPIDAINVQPSAKVISLSSRARKWINYAAAACIAFILFGGGYVYFNNKPSQPGVNTYAKADVQKEISGLSDAEIADYLKENNNIGIDTSAGVDDNQQQNLDIQNLLNNVSDEEIQQYLSQDPESTRMGGGI